MKRSLCSFALCAASLMVACGQQDVQKKPTNQNTAASDEQGSLLPKETFSFEGHPGESAESAAFMSKIAFLGEQIAASQYSKGLVMAYVTPEGISYKGFGDFAGEANPEKVVFEVSSITKAFTGMALASMINEGKVQWDTPVTKCKPEGVDVAEKYDIITLGDLVTHTSGLPQDLPGVDNQAAEFYDEVQSADLWTKLSKVKTKDHGKYLYSNYGIALLGAALANCDGEKNWETLVEKRVVKVLGLPSVKVRAESTPGYNQDLQPLAPWKWESVDAGALGALKGNAEDLAKMVQMSLSDGNFFGHNMLGLSQKSMLDVSNTNYGYHSLGFGWFIGLLNNEDSQDLIWLDGRSASHSAAVAISPTKKYGVVILANTFKSTLSNDLLVIDMVHAGKSAAEAIAAETKQTMYPPVYEATAAEVEQVVGSYLGGVDITVRRGLDGELWLDMRDEGEVYYSSRLFGISPYKWATHWMFAIEFKVDSNDQVNTAEVVYGHERYLLERESSENDDGDSDGNSDVAEDSNSDSSSDIEGEANI